MDAVDALDAIVAHPDLYERTIYRTNLPARAARTAALHDPFHPELVVRLASRGLQIAMGSAGSFPAGTGG